MKHKIYIEDSLLHIDDRIYPYLSAFVQKKDVNGVEYVTIENVYNNQFYVFECPINEIVNNSSVSYSNFSELQETLKPFLANFTTFSSEGNTAKIDTDGQLHVVAGGVVSTENSIQFLILILILNQKK